MRNENFGDVVSEYIKNSGRSIVQIARDSNLSTNRVRAWLHKGVMRPRDYRQILDFAEALDLTRDETVRLLNAADFNPLLADEIPRRRIFKILEQHFNLEELHDLLFDLGIDYENFPTIDKKELIVEIINYLEQRKMLTELVKRTAELRPKLVNYDLLLAFDQNQINLAQIKVETLEVVAEAKLVLVGDGNVGKTSLVNQLVYGKFNPHEDTTQGVAITHWHIDLSCINNQNARINIWDFGGQGNMHATHPYFFSRKAVYIVVLNIREDDRVNRAEYWIRLIRSYGGNSPIIIVANKVDQFSTLLDQRSLKDKYPQISSFARTSCKTGQGIESLKTELSKAVCLLEDINVRTSQSLVKVKKVLEDMTNPKSSNTKETLNLDEYDQICEENGVVREQRINYLRRLSDLGVMLYFGDDPRLELNVVLNPFWVTEGVYKIINHPSLAMANGKLELAQIREILPRNRYASDKAMYILDMMRKFELCFALDEQQTQFLLPDLLPPQQPELPTFNRDDALKLHFEYPVWHGATLTRLLVRLHHYSIKNYYWRNGMLLLSADQNNRALIIADEADRRLRIWVDGELSTRRNFLNRIREELNVIHGIQRNQVVKEWVITNDGGQISYLFLVNLEAKGRETCDIEVEDGVLTINIKEVLDGVRAEAIPDSYRLKELIVERLSLDELDDLCFKFKISLEDIEGELTRDSKARNLIRQFERTRRMPELMSVLRDLRKGMIWQ